jgi:hypothetical protein
MPQLKKDENFVSLIWASKVFYARALEMFGIDKIFIQKEHEKEIIWLVNYHQLEMIHGQ